MLRTVVLTQYRRVTYRRTDRQSDGIAIASTVLAIRALRRAVKIEKDPGISRKNADFAESRPCRRGLWLRNRISTGRALLVVNNHGLIAIATLR